MSGMTVEDVKAAAAETKPAFTVVRPLKINHAELVYPKGGKEAARAALEVIGLGVIEVNQWLVAALHPPKFMVDDILVVSEATPAQLRFAEALDSALESDARLAQAFDRYLARRSSHPQYMYHFGISIPTHEDWEACVERVEEAGRSHPLLAGKIEIASKFEPGDPGAITPLSQAFVRTTALAAEMMQLGFQIELQWAPLDKNGDPDGMYTVYPPDPSTID
jgi:hypothetical protein